MQYHWDSIERCVPSEVIEQAMRNAGLNEIARQVDLGLFSAYTGTRA
jgi:demethylmenaquinone methyltransferase/2-methoxy-6-polyprenyl-1,4-benzoquinol methylase